MAVLTLFTLKYLCYLKNSIYTTYNLVITYTMTDKVTVPIFVFKLCRELPVDFKKTIILK